MSTFEIEKGISIPAALGQGRPPTPLTEALRSIKVKESFFVPAGAKKNWAISRRTSIVRIAKQQTKAFVTRALTENGVKGLRIWRTK